MRAWIVIVVAVALLAVAWVADRLIVQAVSDLGTFGGVDGTRERLLAVDRLGRVAVLVGIGSLVVATWHGSLGRPVAIGLAAVGGIATVLPIIGYGFEIEALYELSRATYVPAQFVVWAGAGMLIAGLIPLLGAGVRGASRPHGLVRLALAAAIVLVALPLDALVESTFMAASARTGTVLLAAGVDLATRLLLLGGLAALLWLTVGGPRDVAIGSVMAVGGFVVFAGLALAGLTAAADGSSPFFDLPVVPYATRWAAGGVMLVGIWELIGVRAPQPASPPGLAVHASG